MKQPKKILLTASTIVVVVIIAIFSIDAYLNYVDNPINYVRSTMPHGKERTYIISKSKEVTYDGVIIPAGAAYEIVMEGDERNDMSFLVGPGRSVGSSRIDLEPYLDKPVYIYGSIDEGSIAWIDHHEDIPHKELYLSGIVVNIHKVELAD
ncbi:MAG: hypothetical protein ACOCXQ_02995 [Patescibacteria group bacterium]